VKAVVYEKPRDWQVRDLPVSEPAVGEVRLRVVATGVCGTDVHLHAGGFFPTYPLTPGHEIVGIVDAIGDGVSGRKSGELVALDNMISCGSCEPCRRARPQYCAKLRALGVTDPGGFAEAVIAPADKCHNVDDLEPEVALLAEPTACVVHGLDVLKLEPGSDVLIFGAGPTGQILAQLLRSGGAGRVTVAARTAFKLDLAKSYGADEIVVMSAESSSTNALRKLAPTGFDVVVDATGAPSVLAEAADLLAVGGTLFVYGMTDEAAKLTLSPYDIFRRELTIKGSFSQAFSFDRAVALLRGGRVQTAGLVTHHFGLGDYGTAIDVVTNDSSCLKAAITL
jgi:D-arabinitol dehydrogenase (NADP+)